MSTSNMDEAVNPEIWDPNKLFRQQVSIGDYEFEARDTLGGVGDPDAPGLTIIARDPKLPKGDSIIGNADFVVKGTGKNQRLVSDDTTVDERYRGRGIAYMMYAYAQSLGNAIKASNIQTPMGKKMWSNWGNDTKHLQGVAEGAPELLKAEMPLVRHIEQELAKHGYTKGTPEYGQMFKHSMAMYRKFGNIDAIRKAMKEGVAEDEASRKTAPGWHSDSVKNPNFNDELSIRRISPPGKRLKSGGLDYNERTSQERTKALMKFKREKGGLTGPKGPLPEQQGQPDDYDPGELDFRGDPIRTTPIARKAIAMLKRASVQDRMDASDIRDRRDFDDFIKQARRTNNLKDEYMNKANQPTDQSTIRKFTNPLSEKTTVVGAARPQGEDTKAREFGIASAGVSGVTTQHQHEGKNYIVSTEVDGDGDIHHQISQDGQRIHGHMISQDYSSGRNKKYGDKITPLYAKLISDHVRAAKPHLTDMADHIFPGKTKNQSMDDIDEASQPTDRPKIRKFTKTLADDHKEVRYEVLDSQGRTRFKCDSLDSAKEYLNAHRGDLSEAQGVAEGSLNEVTQGVEHSEWAENVRDAYPGVKIIKKRTEDGRHIKSQASLNGQLVGQYNMNTGVGTFKAPKQQGVAEGDGYDQWAAGFDPNVTAKPSKTLARLMRIPGFDKVNPQEQKRVATAVDEYLARGMSFDQASVLAQKRAMSEGVDIRDMENSAETMTLDQFVSVYGEENKHIWHEVNGQQGVSEGMDSLTFWKQEAKKAGGADKIDWHAIGIEHGKQGINLNPPYGAGARAVELYGKGLDTAQQSVAEGETMSRAAKGYEKYGKAGMTALAKAGREGASEKTLDTIRDKHDRYDTPGDKVNESVDHTLNRMIKLAGISGTGR